MAVIYERMLSFRDHMKTGGIDRIRGRTILTTGLITR